jgi:hypothetical protein
MNKYLVIWILPFLCFLQSCESERSTRTTSKEEKAREERQAQKKARRDEIVNALGKSHNADHSWQNGLYASTWTVELQERLVGKPIVASGLLVDVSQGKDGKHHLHLVQGDLLGLGPSFEFFVTCAKPGKPPKNTRCFPEYFFVVKVHSVQKDSRYVVKEILTSGSDDGLRLTIRGDCLEVKINDERVRQEQEEAAKTENVRKLLRSLEKK